MRSLNIAIVGFAKSPAPGNYLHAAQLGRAVAQRHWSLLAGNYRGTMGVALEHASNGQTETVIVIERDQPIVNGRYISSVVYAQHQADKHELIAQLSDAAIVIGGGNASLRLVNALLLYKKPVFALRGSGGITQFELPKSVLMYSEAADAIDVIDHYLTTSVATPLLSQA
jgi:SLOG-like protein